jgi:L-rhamnose-H+ transport protein
LRLTIFSGLLLISAGAFSAGSFAIPFGKSRDWKWETYWFICSFEAYILFPLAAFLIFIPDFIHICKTVPSEKLIRIEIARTWHME